RGFKSFRRHPGRNAVIVLLLFVCLTFSMSMLAVKLSADSQVNSIKQTVGTYGEIKVSSEYQMARFEEERSQDTTERQREARSMTDEEREQARIEMLMPEEIADTFAKNADIKTYDKVLTSMISVPDVENTEIETMDVLRREGPQGGGTDESYTFEGNTNGASASDFTTGQKKLVDGSFYTYKDYEDGNQVVLVEKNLAEQNELSVGDTVVAEKQGESGKEAEVELTICGIYETVEAESDDDSQAANMEMFNPAGNKFFAPLSVVQKLSDSEGYVSLGSYYFDNVDDNDALKAAFIKQIGSDSEKYEFATDLADYTEIADPLLKVRNTSVVGLAGALGACALIIMLAMVITVGGRTRELGVLKAIGARDRQVMLQYATEVLCICMVAIILAMAATAFISQPLGNWLLSDKKVTESSEATQKANGGPGGQGGPMMVMGGDSLYKEGGRGSMAVETESETPSLNVVFRGSLLGYAILVMIIVSLLGMAVPIIWINRLQPARVLTME
ncbi:MAG: ABC transporter permease, partial [Actinobacteria bacterium]|nr:ABC transporter permease [Actinomycetota bacterium]